MKLQKKSTRGCGFQGEGATHTTGPPCQRSEIRHHEHHHHHEAMLCYSYYCCCCCVLITRLLTSPQLVSTHRFPDWSDRHHRYVLASATSATTVAATSLAPSLFAHALTLAFTILAHLSEKYNSHALRTSDSTDNLIKAVNTNIPSTCSM